MRSRFKIHQADRRIVRIMSRNNPRWGARRIHGELLKLGIVITEPTVATNMVRHEDHCAVRSPERRRHGRSNREGAGGAGWAYFWAYRENGGFGDKLQPGCNQLNVKEKTGATRQDRTGDLLITNPVGGFLQG